MTPYHILSYALVVWSIILGLYGWWVTYDNHKLRKKLKLLEESKNKDSQSYEG